MTAVIEEAVAALRAGKPVVMPFDTVYGLAAEPTREESAQRLYELKGREKEQPTALVAASVDHLLELLPELRGRTASLVERLLPGPLTLVVPNPARRIPWITGSNPEAIGIRVPDLTGPGAEILSHVGVVIATSANAPGEQDPRRLDEVPAPIREGAGAVLDGGELPGTPSTVIDLTRSEPRVLREGALAADDALARLATAVRSSTA
jgi:L-threonylcarbamoyladenylate synthase